MKELVKKQIFFSLLSIGLLYFLSLIFKSFLEAGKPLIFFGALFVSTVVIMILIFSLGIRFRKRTLYFDPGVFVAGSIVMLDLVLMLIILFIRPFRSAVLLSAGLFLLLYLILYLNADEIGVKKGKLTVAVISQVVLLSLAFYGIYYFF